MVLFCGNLSAYQKELNRPSNLRKLDEVKWQMKTYLYILSVNMLNTKHNNQCPEEQFIWIARRETLFYGHICVGGMLGEACYLQNTSTGNTFT